jgi:serine/threonine protein kinase
MIGDHQSSPQTLHQIKLIDFGLVTDFRDQDRNHLAMTDVEFVGNLAFCSKNAINYKRVSRRDDLISLTYIILYLHKGRLDFLQNLSEDKFKSIQLNKNKATPKSLCG